MNNICPRTILRSLSVVFSLSLFSILVQTTVAQEAKDWPAWMGAERDGVYHETGIIDSIPESGLKVKWRMPVAAGYAGPAVADGKVVVFDYVKSDGEIANDPGKRVELKGVERITVMKSDTGEKI